jgi:hypothetical protein
MFLRVLRGTELGDFFISEMDGFNEMAQTTSVYRYWRQCERADGTTGNRQFDDEIQEGRAMLGQLADLADRIHLFLCSRIPHSDFEGKVGLFGRIDGKMLCSYLIDRSKK